MGLKRIMAMIEVTYAEDDARDLDALRLVTRDAIAMSSRLDEAEGTLASWVVTGAMVDPDPEPTAPDPVDPELGQIKRTT